MSEVGFAERVRTARERLAALRERAAAAGDPEARALLTEGLEELGVAYEELSVAQEELRVQNEALAAAELAAVAERDQYRDLFEFAPNGYVVTDGEGTVLRANRAACTLLNLVPRYLLNKPLAVFVWADDRPAFHDQLSALLRGEAAYESTLRLIPRGEAAGPRTVAASVVPFRDPDTRRPLLRWQFRDVTDERRAADEVGRLAAELEARVRERTAQLERMLREQAAADRRKDEFLATLAHELRGPIAPIRAAVRVLHLKGPDPDLARSLDVIDRQAGQLARLVDDLLDLARVAQGKFVLRPEPVDLAAAARQAVDLVRPAAEDRGVAVVTATAEPVWVRADPARLYQILGNLLGNAVKYTEPGGAVAVRVGRKAGGGEVRVRDTGIGIPPDLLPHVFDLFVQGDPTGERGGGGLGLGLALVKQLVELHGGAVEAHSEGPGRGSEFVVRLPTESSRCPPSNGAAFA